MPIECDTAFLTSPFEFLFSVSRLAGHLDPPRREANGDHIERSRLINKKTAASFAGDCGKA
ncbi:hypothetical protein CGZ80_09345 [Rhodopirellula sp. MGV]|nr:hypothetical protein CGZ80_09345 [Rhodopirellula sp. MGV]PNY34867.1 hypothetical protein C2E31_20930 [Rhodopirellula baltica]